MQLTRLLAILVLLVASASGSILPRKKELQSAPWFCHDLDCPDYKVIHKFDDIDAELRSYGSGSWVSTKIDGYSYDLSVAQGFQRLFKYISGENEDNTTIPMTAPVRVKVVPDGSHIYDPSKKMTVSFFVPFKFQGSAPAPTSSEIFLEKSESMEVFVHSFGGLMNEITVLLKLKKLAKFLDDAKYTYDRTFYYTAAYDPPTRIKDRHNEIWLAHTRTGVFEYI